MSGTPRNNEPAAESFDQGLLLQEAMTIVGKPIRKCGIAHESVARDADDKPVWGTNPSGLPVLNYVNECAEGDQHFGCPHYIQANAKVIREALEVAISITKNGDGLVDELKSYQADLEGIDDSLRMARTGSSDVDALQTAIVPSSEQAAAGAVRILRDYDAILADGASLQQRILSVLGQASAI